MSGPTVTIACCQFGPAIGDLDESLHRMRGAVEEAVEHHADVIVLPELANTGYMFDDRAELVEACEPVDGPTVRLLEQLASAHDVVIVSGFAEAGDDGEPYNSAVLVDATGVRAVYRKAHLWDHEKPVGFAVGDDRPPVVHTKFGTIGVMVCYDLELPEYVRFPALDGAEVLCAPVNWPRFPRPAGERPGEVVRVQADAAVNRMFIAAADRMGTERGQEWLGGSVIVDPDGYPVTELRLGEHTMVVGTVDLSEARTKRISANNDVHADRRPDLYARLGEGTA
ncbi:MAG: nitrilase-related carbon-nitrogen hydrolase [Humibacter sp.]